MDTNQCFQNPNDISPEYEKMLKAFIDFFLDYVITTLTFNPSLTHFHNPDHKGYLQERVKAIR